MSKFDLFDEEQSIILDISMALRQGNLSHEAAMELLSKLLCSYEKLFREMQQLVKMSDAKARQFNQLNHRLKQLSKDLEFQATHDALTSVYNKGAITEILRKQLATSDFVLILFDIDYFKKVNDTYGHSVGDQVLIQLASLVSDNIKHKDYFGRFGGEEFLIVLNDTPARQCRSMANSLLCIIENTPIRNDSLEINITVSMGITLCKKNESFQEVYDRVDKLLYAAKHNGRNRIESDAYCH
jgi:diguanylate cyclase (GGDEF)-like protein